MTPIEKIEALAAAVGYKIKSIMPRLIPPGGGTGQALTKGSADDYDVAWTDVATGGYGGGDLTVDGTLSHEGLVPTAGTGIDQIATFNLSLTLTSAWLDTGIAGADLATGSYAVHVAADGETGLGLMEWGREGEFALHGSSDETPIFLRTVIVSGETRLQIGATANAASPTPVTIRARRMM